MQSRWSIAQGVNHIPAICPHYGNCNFGKLHRVLIKSQDWRKLRPELGVGVCTTLPGLVSLSYKRWAVSPVRCRPGFSQTVHKHTVHSQLAVAFSDGHRADSDQFPMAIHCSLSCVKIQDGAWLWVVSSRASSPVTLLLLLSNVSIHYNIEMLLH